MRDDEERGKPFYAMVFVKFHLNNPSLPDNVVNGLVYKPSTLTCWYKLLVFKFFVEKLCLITFMTITTRIKQNGSMTVDKNNAFNTESMTSLSVQ